MRTQAKFQHNLPDFWNGIALDRIHRMLKPRGQLHMHDVIIAAANSLENIAAFITRQEQVSK